MIKQKQARPAHRFLSAEFSIYYVVGAFARYRSCASNMTDSVFHLLKAIGAAAWKFVLRGFQLSREVSILANKGQYRQYGLQRGWISGMTQVHCRLLLWQWPKHVNLMWVQDLSDIQWRVFREGLPHAAAAMLLFVLLASMVCQA